MVQSARVYLTPIKSSGPEIPKLPVMGPAGVDPFVPRFDKNSKAGQTKMDGDWFIQGADEYMGGEW